MIKSKLWILYLSSLSEGDSLTEIWKFNAESNLGVSEMMPVYLILLEQSQ